MGRLKEVVSRIGVRIKSKPSEYSNTNIREPENDITVDASSMSDLNQFQEFRTMANDRETQYRIYDEMSMDSIISSALEMYADDATQYNSKGQIIWAESDNSDTSAFANRLIDIMNLNANAWEHIYSMVKYGDVYLRIYRDTDSDNIYRDDNNERDKNRDNIIVDKPKKGSVYDGYIEMEDNPAEIFDLVRRGKTVGYVRVPTLDASPTEQKYTFQYHIESEKTFIEPADRYIHICLMSNSGRFPEKIELECIGEDDKVFKTEYKTRRGKSILHDIYKTFKEVSLMEDSLLLNRVTRSSIIRLLQVEVGDMPKAQARETLKRIKQLIEQKNYMDKNDGTYTSMATPGPIDNVIYVPTRDGKGNISASNLGGDVDVKSIADVDYYKNKLYGGLKIPKQFLGDDMEGCLRGDTELLLLCGQKRTIRYLYENKDEYIGKGIMSCNEDGTLVPTIITNIALTRRNARYIRIHIDNLSYVDVTPDHLFMMRDGTFKEAQDLVPGDSLMPHYDNVKNGRRYVLDNKTESWIPQYRLVALHKYGELKKGYQVHHKDNIKINDDFDNLEQITFKEHYDKHSHNLHKKHNINRQELKETDPDKYYEIYGRGGRHNKGVKKSKHMREALSRALKGKPSNNPFTSDNNPMNNEECRIKAGLSISNKMNTDSEFYENACNNLELARKKSVESRKARKMQKIRKVRCLKCGKIFEKWMTDSQYESYLNKEYFVYCCKDHVFGYPNATKISTTTKLLSIANYDIDSYTRLRNSEEYGRRDKYLKEDGALEVMSMLESYYPEVINHKVLDVEWLDDIEDAYDIEVANDSHTFVLSCGIFVHNSGLSAGTSLTKLDSRYARTIKRIQNAYISGITDLVNIFALSKGLTDHVNNFTIKMVSPSTIEDTERDETFNNKVDMIGSFLDLVNNEDMFDNKTLKKVLLYFINNHLNEPEIAEYLEEDDTVDKSNEDDMSEGDNDFSSGNGSFDTDIDIDADFGGPSDLDNNFEGEEGEADVEITNNEEFGDFADEF